MCMPASRRKSAEFDATPVLDRLVVGKATREYRAKQVVFAQGDPADAVFYLQTGEIKLTVVSSASPGLTMIRSSSGCSDMSGRLRDACWRG